MANSLPWTRLATPLALADNELHVWRASLDLSTELLHRVESTLNANEKERAKRFLIPQAREHFLAARGILRDLLGMYLEIDPAKVELRYGPQGKPSLSAVHNSEICFSVSHSQGMGLFVFARGNEVGVDMEESKPNFKGMEIASHFFSGEEIAGLAKLSPTQVNEAFFRCWTRKEAYVKARGQGLSIPLRSFTVSSSTKEQSLRDEKGTVWSCYALEPAQGFSGAVVAAGENWNLRYYDWSGEVETAAPALLPPSNDSGGAD
jgi:4'-phosphopantetheinyl transferase